MTLLDTFGRVADDLRVSVTDRCNFRCTYCMPAEGLPWLPKDELLTYEELTRLVGLLVDLGVRTVRITGGGALGPPGPGDVRADAAPARRRSRRTARPVGHHERLPPRGARA